MADRVGQQLGNYRLVRLLGRGGFAEVYLGHHLRLGTHAALKVLYTRLATKDEAERFEQEARTIAHLKHPHIVRVLDYDVEEDTPFLVMDYAPGGTLRKLHPKGTILPLITIVSYVKQVANALQYAHDQRVIHRDVKSENMLVGEHEELLLSDFGIAIVAQSSRYQSTQTMGGTMAYIAPEQIQGHPCPASDQYSLGIVVYEWLSGNCPFHGSMTEIVAQHLAVPPPPLREKVPTISPAAEQVVLRALSKDPHQRFASVQTFATALEQACQRAPSHHVTLASEPSLPPQEDMEQAWASLGQTSPAEQVSPVTPASPLQPLFPLPSQQDAPVTLHPDTNLASLSHTEVARPSLLEEGRATPLPLSRITSPPTVHRRGPSRKIAVLLIVLVFLMVGSVSLLDTPVSHYTANLQTTATAGAKAGATATAQAGATGKSVAIATAQAQATLPADIPPNGPLDTGAHVIATFNHARQQEGCKVSLSIDPTAYDAATPRMQELLLVNAERQDRGLGVLQLDTTLLSQIDLTHSRELVQYNYFAHSSPINEPGGNNDSFTRLTVNPAINGHNDGLGENIAGGGPAGDALYRFMYEDSASNWGHRQNILGFSGGTPGHYDWIGIGIATGGQVGFYSTLDFLDDANTTTYTPPPIVWAMRPRASQPTEIVQLDGGHVPVSGQDR